MRRKSISGRSTGLHCLCRLTDRQAINRMIKVDRSFGCVRRIKQVKRPRHQAVCLPQDIGLQQIPVSHATTPYRRACAPTPHGEENIDANFKRFGVVGVPRLSLVKIFSPVTSSITVSRGKMLIAES
jgi:hypothetical protein